MLIVIEIVQGIAIAIDQKGPGGPSKMKRGVQCVRAKINA